MYGIRNTKRGFIGGLTPSSYIGIGKGLSPYRNCIHKEVEVEAAAAPFSFGNALKFDGIDDSFNTNATLSEMSITNQITITLWIKCVDTPAQYDAIMGNPTNSSWSDGITVYWNSANAIRFSLNGYNTNYVNATIAAPSNWNHVALVYNSALGTNTIKVYVNGALASEGTSFTSNLTATSNQLKIGSLPAYLSNKVVFDKIAVFNSPLSLLQIQNIYNKGNGADENTDVEPKLWYNLNESGNTTTAVNEGTLGTAKNGTLLNFNFNANSGWIKHAA